MGQEESTQTESQNDPMYEKLETSLKMIYGYNDVYIERRPETHWYIPYFGPEPRTKKDLINFIQFANQVIYDYPRSEIFKLGSGSLIKFEENEKYSFPCILRIWKDDIADINDKASKISASIASKSFYRDF